MNNEKYKHSVSLDDDIAYFILKLFYEDSGYETLIKEFTVDVPKDCEFELDNEKFSLLLNEYNNAHTELQLAISDILDIPMDKLEEFYFDSTDFVLYYNIIGDVNV